MILRFFVVASNFRVAEKEMLQMEIIIPNDDDICCSTTVIFLDENKKKHNLNYFSVELLLLFFLSSVHICFTYSDEDFWLKLRR